MASSAPLSDGESWEEPARKFKLVYTGTILILAGAIAGLLGGYALAAALAPWVGAWARAVVWACSAAP